MRSFDSQNMFSDADIVEQIRQSFSCERRPEHFTNYLHCYECTEHDDLLRTRDLDSLTLEDVGNACWNPISFVSPEGYQYYFPALARIALSEPIYGFDWYFPQLLHALTNHQNGYWRLWTLPQRRAVLALLRHVLKSRTEMLAAEGCANELEKAVGLWSATLTSRD